MKGKVAADPRGLIDEAYRMELTPEECRSIFLDWALGLPEADPRPSLSALLAHYGEAHPDHPMTPLIRDGLRDPDPKRGRRRPRAVRRSGEP